MGESFRKSLEQRAGELLHLKINNKSDEPIPFENFEKTLEEIEFLLERGYVQEVGNSLKSLDYMVTLKGYKFDKEKFP
jgi:hypothetical protein